MGMMTPTMSLLPTPTVDTSKQSYNYNSSCIEFNNFYFCLITISFVDALATYIIVIIAVVGGVIVAAILAFVIALLICCCVFGGTLICCAAAGKKKHDR